MEKSFPKLPPLELLPVGVLLKFTEFICGLHYCLQVTYSLLQLLNFSLQGLVLLLEVPLLPGAGLVVTIPLLGQHSDHARALILHTAGHLLGNLGVESVI